MSLINDMNEWCEWMNEDRIGYNMIWMNGVNEWMNDIYVWMNEWMNDVNAKERKRKGKNK